MISIGWDKRTAKVLDGMMRNFQARVADGEQLFLLELASLLRSEVVEAGRKIPGKKRKPLSYAKKLQVSTVEGVAEDTKAVAVWLERDQQELKLEDLMRTALIIKPMAGADPWLSALAALGPLPADLLPVKITPEQATIIARRIRPDEAQALRNNLFAQRVEFQQALAQLKAPFRGLGPTTSAVGVRVHVDLAWEVLRSEFGFGDHKQEPHWRPAIEVMMKRVPVALEHFAQYLVDGNKAVFDIQQDGDIRWGKVKAGGSFQKELLPFVKKK